MTVVTRIASGPFVVPAGVSVLDTVEIVAGGGGGGNRIVGQSGGGAGAERRLLSGVAVTPAETLDIVIGAGGAGCVAGINGNGVAGGNTTFKRGGTTLGEAVGGGAGQQSNASVGGTGGTGGAGTAGVAGQDRFIGGSGGDSGSGAAGGVPPGGNGDSYGGGGAGGDGSLPVNGGNGASGVVIITYTTPTTALDPVTYSLAIGSINFRHGGRTVLDPLDYTLSLGDVVFGHRTELDPLSYALSLGSIGFSTSGGVVPLPPTNIVLPNRAGVRRSLPATWATLRFRVFDTVSTRTQKLELLREKVADTADYSTRSESATFTETATSGEIIIEADDAGGLTVNLPTAVGNKAKIHVKKMQAAGTVTIAADGAETIDGAPTFAFTVQYQNITLISNNANWLIV